MPNELFPARPTITIADLREIDDEARIKDVDLATRLGFERPETIRQLINRSKAELETYGGLPQRAVNPGAQGGRPTRSTYLNEAQSVLICMFSRTPNAAAVRKQVIDVFMAYRQGKTVPVKQHMRRPPSRSPQHWQPGTSEPGFRISQYEPGGLAYVSVTCSMAVGLELLRHYGDTIENIGVFA